MKTAYSTGKLVWHSDILHDLRSGKLCRPSAIQIYPTSACNLRCRWCAFSGFIPRTTRPACVLEKRIITECIEDFAKLGGRAVEFTGGGEPTCHDDVEEILCWALDFGLKVGLVTNGIDVPPGGLKLVPDLTWLRVSLDAHDAKTYRERKGRDRFDGVLQFLRYAGYENLDGHCDISVSYLVDHETKPGELTRAVTILKSIGGLSSVRIGPVYTGRAPTYLHPEVADELAFLALSDFIVNMVPQRQRDAEQADFQPARRCGYAYTNCVLGSNGLLYPCCSVAYSPVHAIGDLRHTSFEDWWHSEERWDTLTRWRRDRRCTGVACSQRAKNESFYALVEDRPGHVDFI